MEASLQHQQGGCLPQGASSHKFAPEHIVTLWLASKSASPDQPFRSVLLTACSQEHPQKGKNRQTHKCCLWKHVHHMESHLGTKHLPLFGQLDIIDLHSFFCTFPMDYRAVWYFFGSRNIVITCCNVNSSIKYHCRVIGRNYSYINLKLHYWCI